MEHQVGKNRGRTNVWYTLMLNAPDQLRPARRLGPRDGFYCQRPGHHELHVHGATDFLLRHLCEARAGNLRDVLREISYHAHMAQYLTFADGGGKTNSKFDGEKYPDENYARDHAVVFDWTL